MHLPKGGRDTDGPLQLRGGSWRDGKVGQLAVSGRGGGRISREKLLARPFLLPHIIGPMLIHIPGISPSRIEAYFNRRRRLEYNSNPVEVEEWLESKAGGKRARTYKASNRALLQLSKVAARGGRGLSGK